MEDKPKHYDVLQNDSLMGLIKEVNEYIIAGWLTVGPVCRFTYKESDEGYITEVEQWYQTMIRQAFSY